MKTKDLVYVGIYLALVLVLDLTKEMIPFLNLPFGGSINIALIPLTVASFHLGYKKAMLIGVMWWAIGSLMGFNEWYLNFMQYSLDYIVPSIILALSSIFYSHKTNKAMFVGISLMMIIRTISIVISGVYYWADGVVAGSLAAWIVSLKYNVPYSLVTLVVLLIVVPIILKQIRIN